MDSILDNDVVIVIAVVIDPILNRQTINVQLALIGTPAIRNIGGNIYYFERRKESIFNTSAYGGFEQVGSFPRSFSRNDVQMTTEPGDIVLYSGNQLVVFFGSNSWSYTKLGHISLAAEKLAELLGGESTVIEFKYE